MTDTRTILVVGTGNVATSLARRLRDTGHAVHLGSRDAARGSAAGAEHGVAGGAAADLVGDADIVFLAVPFAALDEALTALGPMSGKIVVDCTNPLTDDYMELTVGHTDSAGGCSRCQRIGNVVTPRHIQMTAYFTPWCMHFNAAMIFIKVKISRNICILLQTKAYDL